MTILSVKPKVSNIVKYQVPEHIKGDHPDFVTFLENYYQFLEQENYPLDIIRGTVERLDIDSTPEEFISYIKKNLVPMDDIGNTTRSAPEVFIKSLRDFYRAKGTEKSFEFLFNELFQQHANVDYGSKYVLRPSDNEYRNRKSIIVENDTTIHDLFRLKGSWIRQDSTKAYALIEDVNLYAHSVSKTTITGTCTEGSAVIICSSLADVNVGDSISDILFRKTPS
jgi:hypothetical protein